MRIERVWAMPNHLTFKIKPIRILLSRYVKNKELWIDPYANNSKIAGVTNDLNVECDTMYHLEAYDFCDKLFGLYDGVLFDPPYSERQIVEMYDGIGRRNNISIVMDRLSNRIKVGGYAISFGWNSNGFGKKRGFDIVEILLVCHGGNHNDTIVVVEKKVQGIIGIEQLQKEIGEEKQDENS